MNTQPNEDGLERRFSAWWNTYGHQFTNCDDVEGAAKKAWMDQAEFYAYWMGNFESERVNAVEDLPINLMLQKKKLLIIYHRAKQLIIKWGGMVTNVDSGKDLQDAIEEYEKH